MPDTTIDHVVLMETSIAQLWGTEDSREFVREHYPDFLSTYDGYAFPVQRVDTLKYLLMRYYGGIYIDLDNVCDILSFWMRDSSADEWCLLCYLHN
jgi:mannosyltransferase OCH1-like enzyme